MLSKFVLVVFSLITSSAFGAVSLLITSGGNMSATVNAGDAVPISVTLVSTDVNDKVTGVDYFLKATVPSKLSIINREVTGSYFSDLTKANNGDNGLFPGVLDSNFNQLMPINGLDLGATVSNVSMPAGVGSFLLGVYSVKTDQSMSGLYTISTATLSDTSGWVSGPPTFNESAFSSQGSFALTVNSIPEPTSLMTGLFLFFLLFLHRNLFQRKS